MYIILWVIVLIATIIFEVATASALVSIWFAVGSLVSLLLAFFNVAFVWQVVVFFIVSILSLLLIRPMVSKYTYGNTVNTNANRAIGQRVKLLKTISFDSFGEVKVHGVIWNCRSFNQQEINQGEIVEVLAIEGSKLIVRKVEN